MEILIIAILAVVLFGGGGLLYVSSKRKSKELQAGPKKSALESGATGAAGGQDDDEPAGGVGTDVLDRPAGAPESDGVDVAVAPAPELERPEAVRQSRPRIACRHLQTRSTPCEQQ